MKVQIEIGTNRYSVNIANPLDISIPVRFDDFQLSVFGTPPAQMKPLQAGSFIGAVSQGGSCNCETYTITPHCNGTHTECVGHITGARMAVTDVLQDTLIPATVITIKPIASTEKYDPVPAAGDVMITRAALIEKLSATNHDFFGALIIRTTPNGADKITRDYNAAMPAYFTNDAMEYIASLPFQHLLVDTPSVDRLDDEGKLSNHRIFWGVAPGVQESAPSPRTITELIYVPDNISDGAYILNLQVAPFRADASPSRPVLYEVKND
ncbi:MAG: cyclase family protein [Alphaproteobacteria bacterium]|nr:cyclase family protein [Alphaproteobacteria bacterium]